jgi:dipeptidyl aminopeptidase/acylaminoacyl peptidase
MIRSCSSYIVAVLAILLISQTLVAQEATPTYKMPPKAIADLVDAPLTPGISVDPNGGWMLLMDQDALPSIAELSQPELRIAGMRINPRTNGMSRTRPFSGLKLMKIEDGTESAIAGLPDDPSILNVSWSPDGSHVAFTLTRDTGIELWVADPQTARAKRVSDTYLNGTYRGSPFYWLSDNQTLICKIIPSDRGAAPEAPTVPAGPVIKENIGKLAPARTYQDLLKNPFDETLFEYYLGSEVARVTLDGTVTPIGQAGLIRQARPAPNGKYILVQTMHRPFSYLVPYSRFPNRIEIWDLDGNVVREIVDLPLAEEVPISFDAVQTGPRAIGWRTDSPATVYWTEAQDGGDPRKDVEVRDRVVMLAEPFSGDPTPLVSLGLRFQGVQWGSDDLALVWERWRKNRNIRTWLVKPGTPDAEPTLLFDRSYEDRYSDPGIPILHHTPSGNSVLLTANEGKTIFFSGEGASREGNRPFLDEFDLASRQAKRLWQSEAPHYEYVEELLDMKGARLLTRRESNTEPPNFFLRDLGKKDVRQLTQFPHPAPQLADVDKELIRYDREDGVKLTATLYLPPGYTPEQGPLPMLMWAYPREYKSADAAAQVTDSPYRFLRFRPGTHFNFLAMGYAILDNPTMPIIGEGDKEPNDFYVEQLVSSAKAAVDEVVRRGVAHRDRIAIGGHSYGAFMTANLLAHSDLYRAGVARSGAYNRSLTPFGFQAEERTFWQAPEIYFAMSPFMHAQKVNEPILLIHGMADNNSGTFPVQSERFYHALKGHGATARLVMLPHESHGYRARESLMHMYWEMNEWLEKFVKNAPPRTTEN